MEHRRAVRAALLALIVDTSVLYASVVAGDTDHARCAQLLKEWPEPLAVPSTVIVEIDWLSGTRRAPDVRDAVLRAVEEGALSLEELTTEDYARIRELCRRYEDLPLGLVDASIVAIAERLLERKVATLDHRHFTVVRPRHVRSLTLLP